MRTTVAAALVLALAACGGDGGLSLTEPHQVDVDACAPVVVDLAGRWKVDEWGCEVRANNAGGPNCDPGALPWADGEEIAMVKAGADNYTLTIGGESATAQLSGTNYAADLAAGGTIIAIGCADESMLVVFMGSGSNTFAAYAHRR